MNFAEIFRFSFKRQTNFRTGISRITLRFAYKPSHLTRKLALNSNSSLTLRKVGSALKFFIFLFLFRRGIFSIEHYTYTFDNSVGNTNLGSSCSRSRRKLDDARAISRCEDLIAVLSTRWPTAPRSFRREIRYGLANESIPKLVLSNRSRQFLSRIYGRVSTIGRSRFKVFSQVQGASRHVSYRSKETARYALLIRRDEKNSFFVSSIALLIYFFLFIYKFYQEGVDFCRRW